MAVGKLSIELRCPSGGVGRLAQEVGEADDVVAGLAILVEIRRTPMDLAMPKKKPGVATMPAKQRIEGQPNRGGGLGEGRQGGRHIGELETERLRKLARERAMLRHHVAEGGVHGDAALLDVHRAVLLEVGKVTAGGQAKRIQVANWHLHTDLDLEGTQGRGSAEGPVREGHADGRRHLQWPLASSAWSSDA